MRLLENCLVEVVCDPKSSLAETIQFSTQRDGSFFGTSQQYPDYPRHRDFVSAGGLPSFTLVHSHGIRVGVDGIRRRRSVTDIE